MWRHGGKLPTISPFWKSSQSFYTGRVLINTIINQTGEIFEAEKPKTWRQIEQVGQFHKVSTMFLPVNLLFGIFIIDFPFLQTVLCELSLSILSFRMIESVST